MPWGTRGTPNFPKATLVGKCEEELCCTSQKMFLKEEVKVEAETSFKLIALCFVETHFLALNNSVGGLGLENTIRAHQVAGVLREGEEMKQEDFNPTKEYSARRRIQTFVQQLSVDILKAGQWADTGGMEVNQPLNRPCHSVSWATEEMGTWINRQLLSARSAL